MLVTVRGKDMALDESLIEYAERKFGKLDRYLDGLQLVEVELIHEPTREVEGRQVVRANLLGNRLRLRAEKSAGEIHAAIDATADTLYEQLQRFKSTRQTQRHRAPGAKGLAAEMVPAEPQVQPPQPADDQGTP